jgi:hypothetical protein
MSDPKDLQEAPASATLSIVTPKGYNTLFTLRDMTGESLLTKITALEAKLEALGYKPQVRPVFGKKEVEYVEGRTCPKCQGRLVKKTKKNGGMFYQCENKKWDAMLNKNVGSCDYTDWLNPTATYGENNEV